MAVATLLETDVYVPLNPYFEPTVISTMLFGGVSLGGAPTNGMSVFLKRDKRDDLSPPCEASEKTDFCKPREEPSPEIKSAGALLLNSQPSEL